MARNVLLSTLRFPCVIDFVHYPFSLLEHIDDAAIVLNILESQCQAFSVFQSFLCWLVATDEGVPGRLLHALKVLLIIDIDTVVLPAIAIHLQ